MTALGDYLAEDWRFFLGLLRDVTFLPKTTAAAPTTGGIACVAVRRAIDRSELSLAPVLATRQAVVFHVWKYHLGSTVPKRYDVVLDEAGVRWTVERVETMSEGTRWRLTTVREQ
jgi:hypothetical protein